MGKEFDNCDEFLIALDRAIDAAMEGAIAEKAKDAIAESVEDNVYSYTSRFPEELWGFDGRLYDSGGLQDRSLMVDSYDSGSKTLEIEMQVPWQHLKGGNYPSSDLSDVVENNQIYNAPPREFAKPAEDKYKPQFEKDLTNELKSNGF